MNTTTNIEPRWRTYLNAVVFLTPAVLALAFTAVFLFPKLQQICRDAGMPGSPLHGLMIFLREHGMLISLASIVSLFLLEWLYGAWPRYRRVCVGAAVFVLNTTILILITTMFATALVAAPALFGAK